MKVWIRGLLWALVSVLAVGGAAAAQDVMTISGRVTTRDNDVAIPGVVVSIVGMDVTTTTDQVGRYSIRIARASLHGEKVTVKFDAPGLQSATTEVVLAGLSITADGTLRIAYAEDVVVGSRTRGAAVDRPVPVDVISREAIASSGYTETAQLIESLAPSLNFPRPSITDGTDTVRPATLRGLGPDQVLVLINGKRQHQSALVHVNDSIGRGSTGVDLNAIPVAAIDHIEILRDGAAAQYGSDAIAGVINIVLKSGVANPMVAATFGLAKGSFAGNTCTPSGATCTTGDDIHFSDGELADVGGAWGIGVGKGSVTAAVEYRHHNRTNRASFDPRDQITAGDAGVSDVAQPNHRWGDPDTRDLMTSLNANIPLNHAETQFLYAFGGYSRREANSAGFFRRALDPRDWPQIYPLGYLPEIQPDVTDGSGTAGVRGLVHGWTYDASAGYGHNRFAFTIGNTLNVSLGPTVPPNKTSFDAGSLVLNQFVANADFSRSIGVRLFGGPMNVAFGAEHRRENYQIVAGEPDSYGDGGVLNQFGEPPALGAQVFPGFRPSNEVDASRNSVAGYVDIETSVTSWLRFGVAGRAEHYSDFGDTLDGKFTVRAQVAPRAAVRGSISTGFRAPSLGQSFFSSTATNFLKLGQGVVPVESLTLPVNSAPAQVLGAVALKPEQSRHGAAGVVLTPARRLTVSIDGYRIAIDDRIVLSGNFTAAPIVALLAPFGANSGRFFTNAIDTRTNGVDVASDYALSVGNGGQLHLRAAYNYTRSRIVGTVATPPQLAGFESVLFDRIEQRRIECGQPRDSARLGGDWLRRHFGASVSVARYGEFCSLTLDPADDQTFAPKWLTDVDVSYHVGGYVFSAGAENVFNVFPDRNSTINSFNGIETFPRTSPFGMNGRQLYVRVLRTF